MNTLIKYKPVSAQIYDSLCVTATLNQQMANNEVGEIGDFRSGTISPDVFEETPETLFVHWHMMLQGWLFVEN